MSVQSEAVVQPEILESEPPLETAAAPEVPTLPYTLKREPFSSHTKISTLIRQRAEADGSMPYPILDLGCAPAFLRHYLPEAKFYLMGVDIDEKSIRVARRRYNEVYHADLSVTHHIPLKVQPKTLVFGDILEHLVDPQGTLTQLVKNHAPAGTQVIISLPNVAHLYVRLNLLLGRFEYADRGLLDRTHLRFFTPKSARRMIESCGIRINSMHATPLPLPLLSPLFDQGQLLFPIHALSNALAQMNKSLLGYQIIFNGTVE